MKEEFNSRNERDRDDQALDSLFRQYPLGSKEFAARVVSAVRTDRRRRRYARSGWSAAAAAAVVAVFLWVSAMPTGPNGTAYASEIDPEEFAAYAIFIEWESLLADAEGLIEEENRKLLEMLLLAGEELPE